MPLKLYFLKCPERKVSQCTLALRLIKRYFERMKNGTAISIKVICITMRIFCYSEEYPNIFLSYWKSKTYGSP